MLFLVLPEFELDAFELPAVSDFFGCARHIRPTTAVENNALRKRVYHRRIVIVPVAEIELEHVVFIVVHLLILIVVVVRHHNLHLRRQPFQVINQRAIL